MAPLAKVASEGHHNVKHKLDFDKLKPNSNYRLIWRFDVDAYMIVNVEQIVSKFWFGQAILYSKTTIPFLTLG